MIVAYFRIPSKSEKGKYYIVTIQDDGRIYCNQEEKYNKKPREFEGCVAYQMNKLCRHMKEAYTGLNHLQWQISQKYGQEIKEKDKKTEEKE